jgi:DNA-binding transcriptional LysR family regulator
MEISLLRSFLALADNPNYGRASAMLHMSQPALSRQISRLEEQLGGPLFVRGRHGARLTELAKVFAVEARRIVADSDALLERTKRIARGEIGELKIGFGLWAVELVTHAVPKFRKAYPDVRIDFANRCSSDQYRLLIDGSLDMALMRLGMDRSLIEYDLGSDQMMFVLPSDFPLSDEEITPRALSGHDFVLIARDISPDFSQSAIAFLRRHGCKPKDVQESRDFFSVQALVAAGQGISLLPASAERLKVKGIKLRYVRMPNSSWRHGLVMMPGEAAPATRKFAELLGVRLGQTQTGPRELKRL